MGSGRHRRNRTKSSLASRSAQSLLVKTRFTWELQTGTENFNSLAGLTNHGLIAFSSSNLFTWESQQLLNNPIIGRPEPRLEHSQFQRSEERVVKDKMKQKQRLNSTVAGDQTNFSICGWRQHRQFLLSCSLKPLWNMVVPPGNMAGTYKFTRMPTSHFMTFWKEEDVYSAGFFADATWSGRRRACGEASSHSRFSACA